MCPCGAELYVLWMGQPPEQVPGTFMDSRLFCASGRVGLVKPLALARSL